MKEKADKIDKPELERAARLALDVDDDNFWKEYAERERLRAVHGAKAVEARPLSKDK